MHEARLVNCIDGTQTHGYGGKAPEFRHQPGMRIRRKRRFSAQFVAKVIKVLFGQASFQECPRIDTWRSMALKINEIAGQIAVTGMEEMIEPYLHQSGQR